MSGSIKLVSENGWGRSEVINLARFVAALDQPLSKHFVVLTIHRICANLDRLSNIDVLAISQCCRSLINSLSLIPSSHLLPSEWVSVLKCLTTGSAVCDSTLADAVSSPDADHIIPVSPVVASTGRNDVAKEVLRLNASFIVGSPLFLRLLYSLFSKQFLDNIEKRIAQSPIPWDATDVRIDLVVSSEKVVLLNGLLSCGWQNLNEQQLSELRRAGLASLFLASAATEAQGGVDAPPVLGELLSGALVAFHSTLALTSFALPHHDDVAVKTTAFLCKVAEKLLSTAKLVDVGECLLASLPFLPAADESSRVATVFWKILEMVLQRHTQLKATLDMSEEERGSDEKSVPIASPEEDEPSSMPWLESMFQTIPATLDKQSAVASHYANTKFALLTMASRCLDFLSQRRWSDEDKEAAPTADGLRHISVSLAVAESADSTSAPLSRQFAQLYQQLLDVKLVELDTQQLIVTNLMKVLDEMVRLTGLHLFTTVVMEGAGSELHAATVFAALIEYIAERPLDDARTFLARNLCFLLPVDITAEFVKEALKILDKSLRVETIDPLHVFSVVHLVHVLLRRGRGLVPRGEFPHPPSEVKLYEETTSKFVQIMSEGDEGGPTLAACGMDGKHWASMMDMVCDVWASETRVGYPAAALPPPTTEWLENLESGDASLSSLIVFHRNVSTYREEPDSVKRFNSSDARFDSVFARVVGEEAVQGLTEKMLDKVADKVKHESASGLPASLVNAVRDVLDDQRLLPPATTERLIQLIRAVELSAIESSLSELQIPCCMLERARTLFSIWRCPLLAEVYGLSWGGVSRIAPQELQCVRDVFVGRLGEAARQPLVQLHAALTTAVLESMDRSESVSDTCIAWLISLTSSALVRDSSVELVNKVVDRLIPTSMARLLRLTSTVRHLLEGVANDKPKDEMECESVLTEEFAHALVRLCLRGEQMPWKDLPSDLVGGVLEECGREGSGLRVNRCMLEMFGNMIDKEQDLAFDVFCSVVQPVLDRVDRVPDWMRAGPAPLAVFNSAQAVVQRAAVDMDEHTLDSLLASCVDVLLTEDVVDRLAACYPLTIHASDRFASSMLKYRGADVVFGMSVEETEGLGPDEDPVERALCVLHKRGGKKTHEKLLTRFSQLLAVWLHMDDDDEKLLNGTCVARPGMQRLVWRILLIANCSRYVARLCECVGDESSSESRQAILCYSDDEDMKDRVQLRPSRTSERRAEAAPAANNPLCTYSSTEKDYVQQHWYNCHTCGMTDTMGVCSVCAVNCHRGHDLSYSKFSSFFCDCGEKNCASRKHAMHSVDSERAARGRRKAQEIRREKRRDETEEERAMNVDGVDKHMVNTAMDSIRAVLSDKADVVERMLKAAMDANDERMCLAERRLSAAASFSEGEVVVEDRELIVASTTSHSIDVLHRGVESAGSGAAADRVMSRETTGVLTTGTGRSMLVCVAENTQQLHIIHQHPLLHEGTESDEERIEVEQIGFNAKRLSCRDNKAVVVGVNDFLLLRFGVDGEVVDKTASRLHDNPTTNPIVKAVWAPGESAVVAVATVQFVRVFDVTVDAERHMQELVLPMGNVTDVCMLRAEEGLLWLMVLSSVGHLYLHQLNVASNRRPADDNSSYFLTNTVPLPGLNAAISMHYSAMCNLLFVSLQTGTYWVHIPDGDASRLETNMFNRMRFDEPLCAWNEAGGLISAMSSPNSNRLSLIYPTHAKILVQTMPLSKSAFAHALLPASTNDGHLLITLHHGSGQLMKVWRSNWSFVSDLWLEQLPCRLVRAADKEQKRDKEEEKIDAADMITMFERCEVLDKVEYSSQALQRYYDSHELTQRLKQTTNMPVTVLQNDGLDVRCRVQDWNWVVRGVRVEVPAGRAPMEMRIAGVSDSYSLLSDQPRTFDISFTRTQSLEIDKEVTLSFVCQPGQPASIVSIRLYGVQRKEFGWPRAPLVSEEPLCLPDRLQLEMIRVMEQLARRGMFVKEADWMVSLGSRLTSQRKAHERVRRRASRLLRQLLSADKYYPIKDRVLVSDLFRFYSLAETIPSHAVPSMLSEVRMLMATRWKHFDALVHQLFSSAVGWCDLLRAQLIACAGDEQAVAAATETYVLGIVVWLAAGSSESDALMHHLFSIFTHPDTQQQSWRVRVVTQTLMSAYTSMARRDRVAARGQRAEQHKILKWGGALPFYSLTKFMPVGSPEMECLVVARMGETITAEQLNKTELFDNECTWIVTLLTAVLEKVRDEGSIGWKEATADEDGSMDEEDVMPSLTAPAPLSNLSAGSHDQQPSTALLVLALVLMAQLYPAKLAPTVTKLIGMIDWKGTLVPPRASHYRQYLMIRLVQVLIGKCFDHVHNKKKEESRRQQSPGEEEESTLEPGEVLAETEAPDVSMDVKEVVEEKEEEKEEGDKPRHYQRATETLLKGVCDELGAAGALQHCLRILEQTIEYWRDYTEGSRQQRCWSRQPAASAVEAAAAAASSAQHQHKPSTGTPDTLAGYYAMITEVALRLPLQIKRINPDTVFDDKWKAVLCSLIGFPNAPLARRQSRKLLLQICDSNKEIYRSVRDKHVIGEHLATLTRIYQQCCDAGCFSHQQLTSMVEVVEQVTALARERPALWQAVCIEKMEWLLELTAGVSSDAVAASVVELIVHALRAHPDGNAETSDQMLADALLDEAGNRAHVKMLLVRYLIGRDEARRWLLHGMVRSTIQMASRANQMALVRILWTELWPVSRGLGAHAAQLADLLATYAPRHLSSPELQQMAAQELAAINEARRRLDSCGHSAVYAKMTGTGLGWREAMLADASPCLVCTHKQDTQQQLKLSSIKLDARFTTSAQMIKLAGHYEISKVTLKLLDVKRTRSIRRVHLHYTAKAVESAVDLKNQPELWHRAATAVVSPSDTEIVLSVAIPVVTSGLVIEFAEVSEARSHHELHCPRCSSLVQPNPGVCDNCGENVFQCVKCRAINYDEKEPFLCNSCGFCKYARIEMQVTCRPLPAVHPITNDAERAACVEWMGRVLVEMEATRQQLRAARAVQEQMAMRGSSSATSLITLRTETPEAADQLCASMPSIPQQHSTISALAVCSAHCRQLHDELCAQTGQLMALREELHSFDQSGVACVVSTVGEGGRGEKAASHQLLHHALNYGFYSTGAHCFGCICSSVLHSVAVLQSVCDDSAVADQLVADDAVWTHVLELGARYEPLREETEQLLCRLAFENKAGTERLCSLSVSAAETGSSERVRLTSSALLKALNTFPDKLWQTKLKALVKCAVTSDEECVSVACLSTLEKMIREGRLARRFVQDRIRDKGKRKMVTRNSTPTRRRVRIANRRLSCTALVGEWLEGEREWQEVTSDPRKKDSKERAAEKTLKRHDAWLWSCVFSPWSAVRSAAGRLLSALSAQPGHAATAVAIVMEALPRASSVRADRSEALFRAAAAVFSRKQCKLRLYQAGYAREVVHMIVQECARLHDEELRESNMDHWFGALLRSYVELFSLLFSGGRLESVLLRAARPQLLLPLLQSTIYLKRIILKRTRSVDAARVSLERLLRRVSSKDPLLLIRAAVQSLQLIDDYITQAHIVGVILEVIDPVRKDDDDFLLQIDKDPAQEDFLQGRMTGNPYRSSDPAMGPLMRDIKNKVCRDCELVALLDDDNGMELLVLNNIISLALPVKTVYEKLWRKEKGNTPMVIMYRMRGLLGDAVEQFISTLNDNHDGDSNVDPATARLTCALCAEGGVESALRLLHNTTLTASGRFLFGQLRRLLERCLRVEESRREMIRNGAVDKMLNVVQLCMSPASSEDTFSTIGMEYLKMLEQLCCDVKCHELISGVSPERIKWLVGLCLKRNEAVRGVMGGGALCAPPLSVRHGQLTQPVLDSLCRLVPHLCLGGGPAATVLLDAFDSQCDWRVIDALKQHHLEEQALASVGVLCQMTSEILPSKQGLALKQQILDRGVLSRACSYLLSHHPPLYNAVESAEWKAFLGRASLKMVLRMMGGLARSHEASQLALAEKTLPILHRLEQVASADCVGTLAENVVEALAENKTVAEQIEAVRKETRAKKRQLAMAMRSKQLSKMGMALGKAGEVKVSDRKIANEPEVLERADPLDSCCICREPVREGARVPAVYAFAAIQESTGGAARPSYHSVSQMVLVHVDCHQNAIRRSGGRNSDEWTKAALHNAGVLCNMLLPLPLADPADSDWAVALARLEADIATALPTVSAPSRVAVLNDMAALIDTFVTFGSFSRLARGGGRESNAQYLVCLQLLALAMPAQGDLPSTTPAHRMASFLLTEQTVAGWKEQREQVLDACLSAALASGLEAGWASLAPTCLLWAAVDTYWTEVATVPASCEDRVAWLKGEFRANLGRATDWVYRFDDELSKAPDFDTLAAYLGLNVNDYSSFFPNV